MTDVIKVALLLIAMVLVAGINGWVVHGRSANIWVVWYARLAATAVMSVAGLLAFRPDFLVIADSQVTATVVLILSFSTLALLINFNRPHTKRDKLLHGYLYVVPAQKRYVVSEALIWLAYLLPYEFIMRGLLLPFSLDRMPIHESILFNALFYALVHIQQGAREAVGAFTLGCVLCVITIYTGNFWAAFFIHATLAISNSYFTWWLAELCHELLWDK